MNIFCSIRLCNYTQYDEYLNTLHLSEVLQIIISNVDSNNSHKDNVSYLALYLLSHLNNSKILFYILKLPKEIR